MGQLSLTLLRLGFLVLLWVLVLSAIAVLRADIYGTRVLARGRGLKRRKSRPLKTSPPERKSTRADSPGARAKGNPRNSSSYLAVVAGPLKGTTLPLGAKPVFIGRSSSATLVIDDDYCSAKHVRIFRENDAWMVEDLGSTNGTYLNDAKLSEPTPIESGMRIRLGETALEVWE